MEGLFARASRILPGRPVTEADYRKLLIDLPGVRNAWLHAAPHTLYADPARGTLAASPTGAKEEREIAVRGRYRVLIDYMDWKRPTTVLKSWRPTMPSARVVASA